MVVLRPGEKVHLIQLRRFERDLRRHFVGVVEAYDHGMARLSGYVFVIDDQTRHTFQKRPDRRTKVISLLAGEHIVNVLPPEVDIEAVHYVLEAHRLVATDGRNWKMDIKEFGWN